MKRTETNTLKGIKNGLCFILMAGIIACNGESETEAAEDNVVVTDEVVVVDTWDEDEYHAAFDTTSHYEAWDVDEDKFLSEEEFTTSFYQTWDLNNDGRISQGEWNTVLSDYGNVIDAADWQAWDTDGDGFMERVEFDTNFAEMGWHENWDKDEDNLITEREYTTGVFTMWDTNGDNVLDETEYIHHNTYYGN